MSSGPAKEEPRWLRTLASVAQTVATVPMPMRGFLGGDGVVPVESVTRWQGPRAR